MSGPSLAEFLLARYEEDESVARDAQHQQAAGRSFIQFTAGGTGVRRLADPGWWLDDLRAKRRIVEREVGSKTKITFRRQMVLQDLASVYAGHPDYDESWRP